jgi:hypothetical protein
MLHYRPLGFQTHQSGGEAFRLLQEGPEMAKRKPDEYAPWPIPGSVVAVDAGPTVGTHAGECAEKTTE